ncbi:MAG TPA: heme-binding protein [Pyrinomonadaceae bacterium]
MARSLIKGQTHARPTCLLIVLCLVSVALCPVLSPVKRASAEASGPILISEETSTRAVALDSVTRMREPFPLTSPIQWGTDKRTRIVLFAMHLSLQAGETASAVTALAEDGAHRVYPLAVEYVGPVPEQAWASAVIVRLNDEMNDVGDVLVRITYRGAASNRVRVGIGHLGGGPPDDAGAQPTPGSIAPAPPPQNATAGTLTTDDVRTLISQAVSTAVQLGRAVTVAVTDREGNVIGVFQMTGAPPTTLIRSVGAQGNGLEGMSVSSTLAAISKAGTGALFSTTGNAFTTRTAGFIIQEHFPPGVSFRPGGPLYGVQFSSLPCSDIKKPGLPLGLSGDPGGLPVYKNGAAVGGIGIEGDGLYGVDRDPMDFDQPFEEVIAASAVRGFEPPATIRGDNILVDGIRLPFTNVENAPTPALIPFGSLPGAVPSPFTLTSAQLSAFTPATIGGINGEVDTRFFPFTGGSGPNALTAADVERIIAQGAQQASITRAAIRYPLGSSARVTIAVVDVAGQVLGVFRITDAPVFGFDVSVQKARTAAFFSRSNAAAMLRGAGFASYADRAATDGLQLDGSIAFSARAIGFLHRPFFPDGINDTNPGPFSTPLNEWSVFNPGFQLDLVKANVVLALGGSNVPCTSIPGLPNGIQIFAGSVPLYKNGALVGAIGISGDGIDQDDIIAAAGANGYAPPVAIRSDQVLVRGVRLPFLKFPRSPEN